LYACGAFALRVKSPPGARLSSGQLEKGHWQSPRSTLAFNHPEYRLFDSDKTSSARTVVGVFR
jgi:hypothetical protein